MGDKTFVNEFLTIGFSDYFFGNSTSFERHIIECLTDIYDRDELKNLYINRDENGFERLICKYGVEANQYESFLRNTQKYEKFKEENIMNPSCKSDVASIVEVDIITLYLYKCLIEAPTLEELSHFENNLLNNFSIIKLHFNTSLNPNRTREFWNKKKKIIMSDNVELVEIKPKYLDDYTYAKYGVDLNDVKKMDYRMIEGLNKYITARMKEEEMEAPVKLARFSWNTAISSGNGYVDALLVISIIATELSIGLIYLFLHIHF